jgi:hypothetical protein
MQNTIDKTLGRFIIFTSVQTLRSRAFEQNRWLSILFLIFLAQPGQKITLKRVHLSGYALQWARRNG